MIGDILFEFFVMIYFQVTLLLLIWMKITHIYDSLCWFASLSRLVIESIQINKYCPLFVLK